MARILIVDDEADFREAVRTVLSAAGHDVVPCPDVEDGIRQVRERDFDVVLADLRMPGGSGLDLLREAAGRLPDCILIVLTAFGSLDSAIDALRIGVHDFVRKPVDLAALRGKVDFLVRHQATLAENRFLRGAMEIDAPSSGLIGTSAAMEEVRRLIARVAPTDSTVLVAGETGTGKELVARAIHQASPRRARPFLAINCGSIPEGLLESELFGHVRGAFTGADRDKRGHFEVAGEGTIFLDEVAEMPPVLQPKILRAIEAREAFRVGATTPFRISARLVAATHGDLEARIREGRFRADLFYRLNVFTIRIPPLRERPQDIAPIATHLLGRLSQRMNRPRPSFEPGVLRALERYPWPGNVRELANVLERAIILSDGPRITSSSISGLFMAAEPGIEEDLKRARRAFERAHVGRVLARYGGDKRRAAEALGIDISSLYRKLEAPDAEGPEERM